MSNATKRSILRVFHLILSIPILGCIYEPAAEAQQYVGAVRFTFAPILIFSGYWMYAGLIFAIIGVAVFLGVYRFYGFGPALISQVVLFVLRKIWLVLQARRRPVPAP